MIDIKLLRNEPGKLVASLEKRRFEKEKIDELLKLDGKWREVKKQGDELRSERNRLGLEISALKKDKKNSDAQIKKSSKISAKIKEIDEELKTFETKIMDFLLIIPNLPDESVPVGKDENDNKEVRRWGKPIKNSKDVLPHYELGAKHSYIDFERGVKLAGHRFAVLKGPLARLERALINFMLSVQTSNGYEEILPPFLVNTKTMTGTGQLPKFEVEQYRCKDDDLWLVPTAEVPLTNLYSDEIIEEKDLPIKVTAYTPCFRREAGSYGKDIKGLIRQHQFNKVELVKIVQPQNSFNELESLTRDAERILQLLNLPYRVVELCTGDLGFASAKTYDIEVWIPSQDRYREISSCSNCTDFQARRANIRFRNSKGELGFAHTLNGSGLAVGRTLIAILENYQEGDVVGIPKALRDYMGSDSIELG